MNNDIYMVGSFSGWRQEFIDKLPNVKFDNPINHTQYAIAKLVYDDMNSASTKPSLAYIPAGKRLGTMSYCELGAARAAGMPIIAVDENKKKDSILEKIASYKFDTKDDAFEFLKNNPELQSNYEKFPKKKVTEITKPCSNIMIAGDLVNMRLEDLSYLTSNKEFSTFSDSEIGMNKIRTNSDLLVVGFDNGKKHDPKGLFAMGLAYRMEIPTLLLEGNKIPYPPLNGVSRRQLTDENMFDQAAEYIRKLESQHIKDEALVYYEVMKEFNQ